MLPLRLCAVLALGLRSSVTALSVTDRFIVDLTTQRSNGGCGYIGKDILDTMMGEALTLAKAGVAAVNDFDKPEAARLLNAFFNQKTALDKSQLSKIKSHYASIRDWLSNGGAINAGHSSNKPRLYCHHTWLERQSMDDIAYDAKGVSMMTTTEEGLPRIAKIHEIEEYRAAKAAEEESLRLGGIKNPNVVPYWSNDQKSYLFTPSMGTGKTAGLCSPSFQRGATQHVTPVSTLTLCPRAFKTSNSALSNKNVIKLRGITAIPKERSGVKQGGQELLAVLPSSSTFFHELFHLVLGNLVTYPEGGEIDDTSAMMEAKFDVAMVNPETFARVAVAYDYTMNSQEDNGWKVEFYTGYATQD